MKQTLKAGTAAMLISTLVAVSSTDAADGPERSDHQAIIATAYDYAFGVANNDRERIERAFAMDKAQLKLRYVKNGEQKVFIIPIRKLMEKVWLNLPMSPDHFVDILDLQVIGGVYATITINNNDEFFDMLSLYKLNGDWKIVDKLAIRHPKAPPANLDLEAVFGEQD